MNLNDPKKYTIITGSILFILGIVVGVPLLTSGSDLAVLGLIILEIGVAGFFMNVTILLAECCCCDKKTGTWVAGVLWVIALCIWPNLLNVGLRHTDEPVRTILFTFCGLWGWVWFCCTVALITLNCCNNNSVATDLPYPTPTMEMPSAPPLDIFQKKATYNYDIPVATPV